MSFLAAHGTVRYNDRRLLVEPEVGSLIITATQINTLITLSGMRVRGDDGDYPRRIYYDRRVVPCAGRQGRLAEDLMQVPPAPH